MDRPSDGVSYASVQIGSSTGESVYARTRIDPLFPAISGDFAPRAFIISAHIIKARLMTAAPRPLTDTPPGILPAQEIAALVEQGVITLARPLAPRQIQPASLDLRLGEKAYRVRASFLPGPGEPVSRKLDSLKLHEIDLRGRSGPDAWAAARPAARCSSASGFCVGWALSPSSVFSRSWPEQIGISQSDRIWMSSFSAFRAL